MKPQGLINSSRSSKDSRRVRRGEEMLVFQATVREAEEVTAYKTSRRHAIDGIVDFVCFTVDFSYHAT